MPTERSRHCSEVLEQRRLKSSYLRYSPHALVNCALSHHVNLLGCLKDSIPNLTRSSLHRCLERHGISRLPDGQEKASKRGKFAETTIGYVHLDHCELRLADGKLHMFLAIDRVSKFTYVEFHDRTKMLNDAAFLHSVIEAFPYRIHTVLTDNGMAFADLPKNRSGSRQWGPNMFDRACLAHGIEHKLKAHWTNGQAERMNRTIKDATTKVFHYPDLESLKAHVVAFVAAYNFAKHLKALRWRTPYETLCQVWAKEPSIFKLDPRHLIPGPNSLDFEARSEPLNVHVVKVLEEARTNLAEGGAKLGTSSPGIMRVSSSKTHGSNSKSRVLLHQGPQARST